MLLNDKKSTKIYNVLRKSIVFPPKTKKMKITLALILLGLVVATKGYGKRPGRKLSHAQLYLQAY